jgi:hypothetical protein
MMTYPDELTPRVPNEVAALLAALQFRDAKLDGILNLTEPEWHSLLRFCELAHLTLPLAQLQICGLPVWVSKRLETNVIDNALRFNRVKETYEEVAESFKQAGVDHIVIKGFTQAPDYVLDPRLRQQSDLDLYCPPGQITSAQAVLESIGYVRERQLNYSFADHTPTMLRLKDWTWRGNAFDPDMPLSVELHFCLWNAKTSGFAIPEIDQFWQRRLSRDIDGMHVRTLSPVDQLGHIALHVLRNLLAKDTIIHHLYELANFLHNHADDDDFWSAWRQSHPSLLRSKEAIALYLAHRWFSCDVHEFVQAEIDKLPATRIAWLLHFGNALCEGMFVENKDVVWLHLSFLPGTYRKLRQLRRTFLPNRVPTPKLPAVVLNERRLLPASDGHATIEFLRYISRRFASHSKTSLKTLRRGISWRVSSYKLSRLMSAKKPQPLSERNN